MWVPDTEAAQLLDWWRPLMRASCQAREEQLHWPIHVDQFDLVGRLDRPPRPQLWVYRHRGSGRELVVDAGGQPYRFIPHQGGRSAGRFKEMRIREAVWRAGIPDHVTPVWYGTRPPPLIEPDEELPWSEPEDRPRLRLVQGGRAVSGGS